MDCKFSKSKNRDKGVVRLDGQEILKRDKNKLDEMEKAH